MELTGTILKAREKGLWTEAELTAYAEKLKKELGCDVDWDPAAGEEWLSLTNDDGWAGMVHGTVKIAFLKKPEKAVGTEAEVIWADSFDEAVWSINTAEIAEKCPELCWHAVDGAVDTAKLSLKDLYFATL